MIISKKQSVSVYLVSSTKKCFSFIFAPNTMKLSRSSGAKARDVFRNNASATAYSAPWGLFSKLFYLILAASISAQTWLWIVNSGKKKIPRSESLKPGRKLKLCLINVFKLTTLSCLFPRFYSHQHNYDNLCYVSLRARFFTCSFR